MPAREGDEARDIALLERAVAGSIRETLDWDGEIDFSSAIEFDRDSFELQRAELDKLFTTPVHHTFNYTLWPGWQVIVPKYDRWWAVGHGMSWAHVDGKMFVIGGDGFSASGFGIYLEADEEGYVSIVPHGPCSSTWASFKHLPDLRSSAGAGAVVYDGNTLLVSRQPILCDVRGPKEFAGETFKPDFGKIATPPLRGTFETVPLSPVIAPIGPGRQLLVWFYHWHVGANMAETPFWPFITSEVPMVFVNFGKGPIVR